MATILGTRGRNTEAGAPQGRGIVAQGEQPWVRVDKAQQAL